MYESGEAVHPLARARYDELLDELDRFRRTGRLLDLGFGAGHFMRAARDRGWQVVGTEVSTVAVRRMREEAFDVRHGEGATRELWGEEFDGALLIEVIEHVADFRALLADVAAALRRGGLLILSTPNVESLTRHLIGPRWRIFANEHRWYFDPGSLRRALGEAGLRVTSLRSRNIYPPDLWHGLRAAAAGREVASAGWAPSSRLRRFALRTRVGRAIRWSVNFFLELTGMGDTLWGRAVRPGDRLCGGRC